MNRWLIMNGIAMYIKNKHNTENKLEVYHGFHT